MIRKPRDYIPYLKAEYARQHPMRPPKTDFSDECLALTAFIMRQLDPDGTRAIIEPPMPADGYEVQPSVKASVKRGRAVE